MLSKLWTAGAGEASSRALPTPLTPSASSEVAVARERQSIGERLEQLKGIGPGFDHLRIGLALSIFTWHSFSISYGQDYASTLPGFPVPVLLAALLPMFFALSGFLIMGSALRTNDLKTFITFRVLRIVPALFTEITISALILGPLLTALPLKAYFLSPMFFEYFGSLIGRVRFSLPGLFLDNPAPELVNFALWTVGPEILCYIFVSLLMLTGIFRSPRGMFAITIGYAAVAITAGLLFGSEVTGEVLPSKLLIFCFFIGNLFYLYRYQIRFSGAFAVLSFLGAMALVYLSQRTGQEVWSYLAIPGFVYGVVVIGLSSLPPLPFFNRGDYSYGLYIYGFPIQQAVAHFLPHHREWYWNWPIALPVTLLFAICSWHLIEKPVLGLRKKILGARTREAPATRRRSRKVAIFVALGLYGAFVLDSANVLPVRPGAKMMLYGFGMYQYKDTDERPSFLQ
ncbi:MAG TPA: acyltransferase [Sphingobium sp.]|nr:acyltransferase [Sphingobium sp.]